MPVERITDASDCFPGIVSSFGSHGYGTNTDSRTARRGDATGRRREDLTRPRVEGHEARHGQSTHPKPEDLVTVHYTGLDDRRKDVRQLGRRAASRATFPLNRVIAGWTEGVQLMVAGETRRFWIPEELAYKGRRDPQGHARVRRRAALVRARRPQAPVRREGAAVGREEDRRAAWPTRCIQPGKGTRHPSASSQVTVHYTGWTTDGKMFDSSVTRGEPATFPLNGVIPGWTEGVQLMVEGEKTRFWIPENAGVQGTAAAVRDARLRCGADQD